MTLAIPTFDELYSAVREEIESRNPGLTDWYEGSNLDALTGAASIAADEVIRIVLSLFRAQFVDTAEGDDLDALALDRFGLVRNEAVASRGTLTFTRGTSTGTITIPAGTVVEGTGTDGETVQVATSAAADLVAGASTVDVSATCTVTGPSGNVAIGTLTTIPTPLVADPDLTVTNGGRFVGGADEESDDAFRARIRRYFQTLRRGTVAALEAGALSVPGVAHASVDETNLAADDGGYVSVYISDADGYANAALVAEVAAELEEWRAAGIWVQVAAAVREEATVTLVVHVAVGSDLGTLRTATQAAVMAYVNGLAPGETLRLSQLHHVVCDISQDVLYAVVSTPTADQAPAAAENVLRLAGASLTLSLVDG